MDDQVVFRVMLVAFILVGMVIGISFRRRAARTGERISRRGEGPLIMVALRVSGALAGLSVVAFVVSPRSTAWGQIALPDWLRLCGAVPGLAGLAWLLWVFRHLGANVTDTVVVRSNAYLVTSGPYRWVRHPMYVGGAGFLAAWFLLTANWVIVVFFVICFVLLYFRTAIEEANLIERFGDEYRAYMQRTGRFLPRVRR